MLLLSLPASLMGFHGLLAGHCVRQSILQLCSAREAGTGLASSYLGWLCELMHTIWLSVWK